MTRLIASSRASRAPSTPTRRCREGPFGDTLFTLRRVGWHLSSGFLASYGEADCLFESPPGGFDTGARMQKRLGSVAPCSLFVGSAGTYLGLHLMGGGQRGF